MASSRSKARDVAKKNRFDPGSMIEREQLMICKLDCFTLKTKRKLSVLRRRFALPRQIVEEAARLAPPELKGNWNRLVQTALEQFIIQRKRQRFAEGIAEMAKDPQAMATDRKISEEFSVADADGVS